MTRWATRSRGNGRRPLRELEGRLQRAAELLAPVAASPPRLAQWLWLVSRHRADPMTTAVLLRHRNWLRRLGVRTLLDVGANRGQFCRAWNLAVAPATTHAFEPLYECHADLTKALDQAPAGFLHGVALGAEPGSGTLHRTTNLASSSLRPLGDAHRDAFPAVGPAGELEVEISSLDRELADSAIARPCMLKLDVQGTELAVVRGATETLGAVDAVWLEIAFVSMYEDQPTAHPLLAEFEKLGFHLRGVMDELHSHNTGEPMQADIVLMRPA